MKPIFEIKNDYLRLIDEIEENGGEITPEIETGLAITKNELQVKTTAYVSVIKSIEASVKTIDDELKRLSDLKRSRVNMVDSLKERLKNAMQAFEIDEIKTDLFKVNFRKSESVNIYDVDSLPVDCKIVKVEPISKTELKKRIKSGEIIPGVNIVENQNLQIK